MLSSGSDCALHTTVVVVGVVGVVGSCSVVLCWTSIDIEFDNNRIPHPSKEDEVLGNIALGVVWFLEFLWER